MTDPLPVDSERRRNVFVVHGRNEAARVAMFTFLRSLGLRPIEWSQAISRTRDPAPFIGKVLDVALDEAQAVVVLLSPDEIALLRAEYADGDDDPEAKASAQARPNVLFEAGLALGRAAERTILVEFGVVRHFSDIAGRHVVRLNNTPTRRQDLASRLEDVGCAVDRTGNDWLVAGDFTPPPPLMLPSDARWPLNVKGPGVVAGKCRGWIDSPSDGDTVGTRIALRGGARDVPEAHHLWIATRVDPGGLLWPKDTEIMLDQNGHFDVHVYEGGNSPRLYITLLLVTAAVSNDFDRWIEEGSRTGHYPGVRPLPDSYVELVSVFLHMRFPIMLAGILTPYCLIERVRVITWVGINSSRWLQLPASDCDVRRCMQITEIWTSDAATQPSRGVPIAGKMREPEIRCCW